MRNDIKNLKTTHIQNLYYQKLQEGKTPATIHKLHDIINGVLKQAVKNELIPSNPAENVVLPKRRKKMLKCLQRTNWKNLLKC